MKAFWFQPESPRSLALVRIGVGLVFLYDAAVRWPFAIELYSASGPAMPMLPTTVFEPTALSAGVTVVLHSLLLFALAAVLVGWKTRTSLLIAFVLSAWFGLLDSPGTFKKYTVIGIHLMLLLSFSECGAVWSIDGRKRRRVNVPVPSSPVWPRRLIQLLLCSLYLGAALTKIRQRDFAVGDLLMFSLLDDMWGGGWPGMWLATQPRLLVLASLLTIFFEAAFPLLIWVGRLRVPLLLLAAGFHLMLACTMFLGIFSPVMLVLLLAFVDERDLDWLHQWFRRNRADDSREDPVAEQTTSGAVSWIGKPAGNWCLFFLLASSAALAGFLIQYSADWYGEFRPTRPASFATVDTETMDEILIEQLPRYEDYFHRVELCGRVSNFHAFGEREQFETDMTVHVLARLVPSHPPLGIEYLLIGPDGGEIERRTQQVAASTSHAVQAFPLDADMPAGRYRIILQADGVEVVRFAFELGQD